MRRGIDMPRRFAVICHDSWEHAIKLILYRAAV